MAVAATPSGLITTLAVEGTEDVDVHLVLGEDGQPAGTVLSAGIDAIDGRFPGRRGTELLAGPSGPGLSIAESEAMDGPPRLMVRAPPGSEWTAITTSPPWLRCSA